MDSLPISRMDSSAPQSAIRTLLQASSVLLSNHELPDVLEGILKVAEGTLAADAYALWRCKPDSDEWKIEASHGLSAEYVGGANGVHGTPTVHEPILMDDLHSDPRLNPRTAALVHEGIVAMGVFPVVIRGMASATMVFYFRHAHRFSEEDLDYASTVANLAGAAIANSELIKSQAEAAKRAEVLARVTEIINQSLDYDRTAQSIADAVVPMLADWCSLRICKDGQLGPLTVAHQDPEMVELAREFTKMHPEELTPERGALKVMLSGVPELMCGVTDAMLVAAAKDAEHLRMLRALKVHSYITVPLMAGGKALGVMRLVSSDERPELTWEDAMFAQEIAGRAAHALENARLHREQRVLAEQLQRLNSAGSTLAAELDREKLLQIVTDVGTEGTGAQFGAFFYNVEDRDGGSYMLYTLSGVDRSHFAEFPMPRNTAEFAETFDGTGPVRSADITLDPRYGKNAPRQGMPEGHLPVRSYLAVSVRRDDGSVAGGLFFGHEKAGVFTEEAERFAEAVASQAAIALTNAELYERSQRELEARRATEAALERERKFLLLSLRVARAGTWEIDFAEDPPRAAWSNEVEELYGLEPGTFHGTYLDWLASVHVEDRALAAERVGQAIKDGSQWQQEFRIVRPGGEIRWVAGRGQCFYGADGKPVNMIGINMDVTERRLAEEALLRSEKLASAGRMAATIAHEINNPLEAVTNLIYLARMRPDDEKEELLASADRELQRVAHITRQTLGFYREPSAARRFNLLVMVEQMMTLLGMWFQRKNAKPVMRVDAIEMEGVEGEIRQALSNLVSNALDASPVGATVTVRARKTRMRGKLGERAAVRISVADSGQGIPAATRAKMFEPFFTTKKEGGTGLGLWVVREIVAKHWGLVQVRSVVGKGTTISLLLPLERRRGRAHEQTGLD